MRQALRALTICSLLWFTAFSTAFPAGAQETEADQEAVEVENNDLISAVVDEMIALDDLEILLVPLKDIVTGLTETSSNSSDSTAMYGFFSVGSAGCQTRSFERHQSASSQLQKLIGKFDVYLWMSR